MLNNMFLGLILTWYQAEIVQTFVFDLWDFFFASYLIQNVHGKHLFCFTSAEDMLGFAC